MSRTEDFAKMAEVAIMEAKKKYHLNDHKGSILEKSVTNLYNLFIGEAWELSEEMTAPDIDYEALGKEIDDCIIFLMAMRYKANEQLEVEDCIMRR